VAKILIFSDLHLHKWKEFAKTDKNGRNDRLMDCYSVFEFVRRRADKLQPDLIVFVGDLFHKKSILDTETFNLGMDGISMLENWKVLMVPGNHDQATKDGSIHSLAAFKHLKHVSVADIDDARPYNVGSFKVLAIPYTDRQHIIDSFKGETHDLAFVHAGFSGAIAGSYEYRPPEELEVADLGKLPKDRVSVISGHYHTPQSLLGGKVVYVGAPLQHTRSDMADKSRGISLFDTKTGQIERIPLDLPRFVQLTDDDIENHEPDEWDVKGSFVDIVLVHEPEIGIEKFRALCNQLPARGVNVVFTPPPSLPEKRLDVDPSMSLTKMIGKYVDEYAPKELDKKTLLNLFKGVLP
jgi:DNA repair exonuclease SbcCD nuclease subunit